MPELWLLQEFATFLNGIPTVLFTSKALDLKLTVAAAFPEQLVIVQTVKGPIVSSREWPTATKTTRATLRAFFNLTNHQYEAIFKSDTDDVVGSVIDIVTGMVS